MERIELCDSGLLRVVGRERQNDTTFGLHGHTVAAKTKSSDSIICDFEQDGQKFASPPWNSQCNFTFESSNHQIDKASFHTQRIRHSSLVSMFQGPRPIWFKYQPVTDLQRPAHACLQRALHIHTFLRMKHLVICHLQLPKCLQVLDVYARPFRQFLLIATHQMLYGSVWGPRRVDVHFQVQLSMYNTKLFVGYRYGSNEHAIVSIIFCCPCRCSPYHRN